MMHGQTKIKLLMNSVILRLLVMVTCAQKHKKKTQVLMNAPDMTKYSTLRNA